MRIPVEDLAKVLVSGQVSTVAQAKSALGKVGLEIAKDAVSHPPTPRIDTGNLRGSWAVSVGRNMFATGTLGKQNDELGQDLELRVGFNVPYALPNETGLNRGRPQGFGQKSRNATPKPGNWFLKTKIQNKARIYLEHLASYIGAELR